MDFDGVGRGVGMDRCQALGWVVRVRFLPERVVDRVQFLIKNIQEKL